MSRGLSAALEKVYAAEKQVDELMRGLYPTASGVAWMHNGRLQRGAVLSHGYGGKLRARNYATGRDVWVKAERIAEAELARGAG